MAKIEDIEIWIRENGDSEGFYDTEELVNHFVNTSKSELIEKALKWYCRDCECNDNCKDTKCFFYGEYERYLKGDTDAIPPKLSHCILNEDGDTSDDYSYRHFIKRMQETFIEKAIGWIDYNNGNGGCNFNEWEKDFKKAMMEE